MKAWIALLMLALVLTDSALADNRLSARAQYFYSAEQFEPADRTELSHIGNLRAMAQGTSGDFEWGADYVFLAVRNESLRGATVDDNSTGLFDLTQFITLRGETGYLHRLDRLYIGQTVANFSWKAGRYAVSWGNGLSFNPMDMFNPFRPDAIDTEYKVGDDMLYAQYLLQDGSDLQLLVIPRRNPLNDELRADQSSFAVKLHGIRGTTDYDLLLAQHYDDAVIGAGFASDIDGLLWRGDLVYSAATAEDVFMLVTSVSYSWLWAQKPASGYIEFFSNSLGLDYDDGYQLTPTASTIELLERIGRGELFTIGRYYLSASVDVEMHPLVHVAPTLFWNLDDGSSLLQMLVSWDLAQDLQLRTGFNIVQGRADSEYDSPIGVADAFFLLVNAYF